MTPQTGPRALVTGAGGFVGDTAARVAPPAASRAARCGRAGGRRPPGRRDGAPGGAWDDAVIFHLGTLIGIPYSYTHPREVVETNVGGTLNVLLAAHEKPERSYQASMGVYICEPLVRRYIPAEPALRRP